MATSVIKSCKDTNLTMLKTFFKLIDTYYFCQFRPKISHEMTSVNNVNNLFLYTPKKLYII